MSNLLYNFGLYSYAGAASIAAFRSSKVSEMLRGQAESLEKLRQLREQKAPGGFDYWFHAASLGEFEQARTLIEAIKDRRPGTTVLLSFFSPSGYKVRHSWPGADAVVYLPFDTPGRVRRFLDAAKPHNAIFVKYEFWANYLNELQKRRIPTYIISAIFRPSQRFFKPWGGFWRGVLRNFNHLFVQDENSLRLLSDIGLGDRTTVAGDTRFDRVAEIRSQARDLPEIEQFISGAAFTLVAGSSWQPDEQLYIPWLHRHPQVKAIIAPHEFDDRRLQLLSQALGSEHTVTLSQIKTDPSKASGRRYLIIDCFGLLSSIYRYGNAALIGGGFGSGIHNINEAAVYGIPVIFGPNNHKFREAADLQSCGGGFCYRDDTSLDSILDTFLSEPDALATAGDAAGRYIDSHTGATEIILQHLI